MSEQTTDHLSGAVEAVMEVRHQGEAAKVKGLRREVEEGRIYAELLAAEPFFATYYEDKGAEKLKSVEAQRDRSDALAEEASHDAEEAEAQLAAAEDKGRSEERERLLKAWPTQQATEAIEALHDRPGIESATAEESAIAAIRAALDSDQEGR